jgi:hypothetical protein
MFWIEEMPGMDSQHNPNPHLTGRRLDIEHEKQILAEEQRLVEEHERNLEGLKNLKRLLYEKNKQA